MDQRSIKRPRSSTPTNGESPKKKSKSTKKNKTKKKSQASDAAPPTTKQNKSSLDETATADGQIMSQMLSTFSRIEQSRFAAYKRAKLNQNAVQDWIATCIVSKRSTEAPPRTKLADLVAPGSENEIGMVVATAAKVYAQRLVAAAVEVAKKTTSSENQSVNRDEAQQLQPEHVWKALQERRRTGVDPGFYLQRTECTIHTCRPDPTFEQRRLAALAAQDAYDAKFGRPESPVAEANEDPSNPPQEEQQQEEQQQEEQQQKIEDDFVLSEEPELELGDLNDDDFFMDMEE